MKLELLPLLHTQQALHLLPRGPVRFKAYIEAITGGGNDLVLPLAGMNPMGKEHVAKLIGELILWKAETVVAEVLLSAANRLAGLEGALKVGLVLTDDLKGGWTNRYLADMTGRFKGSYDVKHDWALVPIWTSESWDADTLKQTVLTTLYRTLYKKTYGLPVTLKDMMQQEGSALRFAGATPTLESNELEYNRAVLEPHLTATEWAVILPCLYGDAAAKEVGHRPLGLSPGAGYAVALDDISRGGADPVTALCVDDRLELRKSDVA